MRSHDEIYLFLADVPYVTALFWAAATEQWRVRRRILLFLTRLHRVHPILMGRDLVAVSYTHLFDGGQRYDKPRNGHRS